MFEACQALVAEMQDLEQKLADPTTHGDPAAARKYGKRHAELRPIVAAYTTWLQLGEDIAAAKELADEDAGFAAEVESLTAQREDTAARLGDLLLPRDPLDASDCIVEIKAGEGGEESALFAGDLLRMYLRWAERRGWKTEILDAEESDLGGYKDVSVAVKARGAGEPDAAPYANLKFEGGVHRVQRVPVTESQGRIHTSAAGVLVLPETEDVEVEINDADLRIDVYRSSGPGGQSVNTTDSAVRITHVPTGIVVSCQNEKSQLQNKEKAMALLKAKLLVIAQEQRAAEIADIRGDIVEAAWGNQIRNYVFHPYQMVKDLRTQHETTDVQGVMDGDLDPFIQSLLHAGVEVGAEAAA